MVPGFRYDAHRLKQHGIETERGIDLHGELRRDAPALRAEAVQALDAVLGVEPVAAHVPLAGGAGRAGDRIGCAHDADNVIALCETIVCFQYAAERLVAEDQPLMAARRLAVIAFDDFAIRAAHAKRNRLDQQRARRCGRLRHIAQLDGIRIWWTYRDGAQEQAPRQSAARRLTRVDGKSSRSSQGGAKERNWEASWTRPR